MIIYGVIDWKTLAYNYVKYVLNKIASFIPFPLLNKRVNENSKRSNSIQKIQSI